MMIMQAIFFSLSHSGCYGIRSSQNVANSYRSQDKSYLRLMKLGM